MASPLIEAVFITSDQAQDDWIEVWAGHHVEEAQLAPESTTRRFHQEAETCMGLRVPFVIEYGGMEPCVYVRRRDARGVRAALRAGTPLGENMWKENGWVTTGLPGFAQVDPSEDAVRIWFGVDWFPEDESTILSRETLVQGLELARQRGLQLVLLDRGADPGMGIGWLYFMRDPMVLEVPQTIPETGIAELIACCARTGLPVTFRKNQHKRLTATVPSSRGHAIRDLINRNRE